MYSFSCVIFLFLDHQILLYFNRTAVIKVGVVLEFGEGREMVGVAL